MLRVRVNPRCEKCDMCALVTEGITGVEIPDKRKYYQCLASAENVCLEEGEYVYSKIPMHELLALYISDEIGCSDISYLMNRIAYRLEGITLDDRILDITGQYYSDTGYIKVIDRESDTEYVAVQQYVGELHHCESGTEMILSLISESGYSVDQLMGIAPIEYEE